MTLMTQVLWVLNYSSHASFASFWNFQKTHKKGVDNFWLCVIIKNAKNKCSGDWLIEKYQSKEKLNCALGVHRATHPYWVEIANGRALDIENIYKFVDVFGIWCPAFFFFFFYFLKNICCKFEKNFLGMSEW